MRCLQDATMVRVHALFDAGQRIWVCIIGRSVKVYCATFVLRTTILACCLETNRQSLSRLPQASQAIDAAAARGKHILDRFPQSPPRLLPGCQAPQVRSTWLIGGWNIITDLDGDLRNARGGMRRAA